MNGKIPIILMTYINPIYAYGIENFAADCERVGWMESLSQMFH